MFSDTLVMHTQLHNAVALGAPGAFEIQIFAPFLHSVALWPAPLLPANPLAQGSLCLPIPSEQKLKFIPGETWQGAGHGQPWL